jgi:hypothetical protein
VLSAATALPPSCHRRRATAKLPPPSRCHRLRAAAKLLPPSCRRQAASQDAKVDLKQLIVSSESYSY